MNKLRFLLPLLLVAVFALPACSQSQHWAASPRASAAVSDLASLNHQVLQLVNQYRKSLGKNELQMIDAASAQAEQHSRNIMTGKTPFGHDGFEQRASAVRNAIGFINSAAENVAYGQMSAEEVVDGWLHSPGHRKNIEGEYNLTGIGLAQGKDGVIYFTQIFVLKK